MSDHITLIKLKKDVANTIDFEKTHTLDLHLKYKGEFAAFNGRLDSIDKRLSNIINTGKKLTKNRFPVIVKNKTIKNYFTDESNYWGTVIDEMVNEKESEDSFYFRFVTKWKNDIDKTIEFIDSTKDDEVILLSV